MLTKFKNEWFLLFLFLLTSFYCSIRSYKLGYEQGKKGTEAPIATQSKKFGDEPINIETGGAKYNDVVP